MANYTLPTNIASGGTTTGHKTHSDTAHGFVDAFDTAVGSPGSHSGKALVSNGTGWAPATISASSSWGANVKDYGAIGDGTNRAVNDATYGIIGAGKAFANLAAAQATVALGGTGITDLSSSDQLDWAAHQWAVNELDEEGGGTVITPRGRYMFNRTLVFPNGWHYQTGPLRAQQVNWRGEGALTVCKATADFGSGQYMVTGSSRGANGGTATKAYGEWRDIRLIGPTESMTVGITPCNMDGWGVTAERSCFGLAAEYFHSGFDIVGDHGLCERLQSARNYYNLFLGYSSNLFGDWVMLSCEFGLAAYAGIAIHGDSAVSSGFKFVKGGCFASPYGIIKLAGTQQKALEDSSFDQFMFEDIGNACVTDAAAAAGGAPTAEWMNVDFNLCQFGLNATYKYASEGAYAPIQMGQATRVNFNKFKNPLFTEPGSLAIFDIAQFNGVLLEGDIERLVTNAAAASKPVFYRRSGHQCWNSMFRHYAAGFSAFAGEGRIVETSGAVTGEGYGLRYNNNERVTMVTAAGVATSPFAGVALEAASGTDMLILMTTRGDNVQVKLTSTTPAGKWLNLSATSGQFDGSASSSTTATVGWCLTTSSDIGRAVINAGGKPF
jgi:hypothetical protein